MHRDHDPAMASARAGRSKHPPAIAARPMRDPAIDLLVRLIMGILAE